MWPLVSGSGGEEAADFSKPNLFLLGGVRRMSVVVETTCFRLGETRRGDYAISLP